MNNGIYCIRAAQYITGEWPVAVTARFVPETDPERFDQVEEGIVWDLEFADGLVASCQTSYSRDGNVLRVETEKRYSLPCSTPIPRKPSFVTPKPPLESAVICR